MKALFDFFSKEEKAGSDTFVLTLKKVPATGDYRFSIRSMTGEKIKFYLSRSGLSPLDNRQIFGEDDL